MLWDPAGGGDHGMLLADPGRSGSFEAYVYISSAVTPVAEQEMWTVGFGTSSTYYNFPDPTTALGFTANGNTGIGWTFVRDELGANLYLIDHNDGGVGGNAISDATIIGSIPITAGVNDGWQRLRLEVASGVVIANFGGTYGVSDGTVFTGAIADVDRGLYISYREGLTVLSDARPFTWDLMTFVSQGSARATAYGVGCDNLSLTTTGAPTIGNPTFSLDVNNIGAIPLAFVAFGSNATNPGLDLSIIGMPGCFGYTADLGLYPTGPAGRRRGLDGPADPELADVHRLAVRRARRELRARQLARAVGVERDLLFLGLWVRDPRGGLAARSSRPGAVWETAFGAKPSRAV